MKKQMTFVVCLAFAFLMFAGISFADQKAGEKSNQKDVSQEVKEALAAIKNYSVEQKDAALKKVKVAVDATDKSIEDLENRLENKWNQMDQTTREKARASLQTLRKKRLQLAEWYGEMRQSSASAWEHVKKGFLDSYDSLSKAFDKAVKEF